MRTRFHKLLILDLDETLIYASLFPLHRKEDFRIGLAYAYLRPGVDTFLRSCQQWFRVAVWTSATRAYAAAVLEHLHLDPTSLMFVWTREHCYRDENQANGEKFWVKDLNRLLPPGFSATAIMVVDDEPRSWPWPASHVLPISKYQGDPEDHGLKLVLDQLWHLGSVQDS